MHFTFDPKTDSVESVIAAVSHAYGVEILVAAQVAETGRTRATNGRSARTKRTTGQTSSVSHADIRAWATKRKIPVSSRGRIPASVIERYEAAHA